MGHLDSITSSCKCCGYASQTTKNTHSFSRARYTTLASTRHHDYCIIPTRCYVYSISICFCGCFLGSYCHMFSCHCQGYFCCKCIVPNQLFKSSASGPNNLSQSFLYRPTLVDSRNIGIDTTIYNLFLFYCSLYCHLMYLS